MFFHRKHVGKNQHAFAVTYNFFNEICMNKIYNANNCYNESNSAIVRSCKAEQGMTIILLFSVGVRQKMNKQGEIK